MEDFLKTVCKAFITAFNRPYHDRTMKLICKFTYQARRVRRRLYLIWNSLKKM